jgi:hypothetical protein
MRRSLILLALTLLPAPAFADVACETHPKSEWRRENEVRARLVGKGYQIRTLKVDEQCYKVEGRDKEGRKVEVRLDPKTLAIVHSEFED